MAMESRCRFCHRGGSDSLFGKLVKYGVSAYAHAECLMRCKGWSKKDVRQRRDELDSNELERIAAVAEAEYEARR